MKRKILAVEDSFEVRIAIEMALTQEGYEARASADGESGWQEFNEFSPDLALLDLRMPGMSGIELCKLIRERSNIPIIIFSAVEDRAEKIDAFEAGADDYVVKGTGIDELLVRVAAQLRWKREANVSLEDESENPPDTKSAEYWRDLAGSTAVDQSNTGSAPKTKRKPVGPPAKRLRYPHIRIPRFDGEKGSAVLVADPNGEAREKLSRCLKNLGHAVIETSSGRQTLLTIGRYLPWLVLCEIVMPDMDGADVLRLVSEHPRTRDVATVVVTSKGSPETRAIANQFGALDCVIKPWTEEEIALRLQWARQSLNRKRALYDDAA